MQLHKQVILEITSKRTSWKSQINAIGANITSTRIKITVKHNHTEIVVSDESKDKNYLLPKRDRDHTRNLTTSIMFGRNNYLSDVASSCVNGTLLSRTLPATVWIIMNITIPEFSHEQLNYVDDFCLFPCDPTPETPSQAGLDILLLFLNVVTVSLALVELNCGLNG